MIDTLIALGSNAENSQQHVEQAIELLKSLPKSKFVAASSLHQTEAVGPAQNEFCNAAAHLQTSLTPLQLLHELQNIEKQMGRNKQIRWGDRIIDLDIIFYGQQIIDYPQLRIPHPQFHLRPFVVQPIFELVPDFQLPFGISLRALSERR